MTNKPHINHNCTQSEAPSCPLISVIIPTRNRSALLPRAIESVLGQTYKNIELIIVDDASHDATPEVVDRYAASDPRVSFLRNPDNLGKSGALNAGIKKAAGIFYYSWMMTANFFRTQLNSISPPSNRFLKSRVYCSQTAGLKQFREIRCSP